MSYNYAGFGPQSGPSAPAKEVPSFGQSNRSPSSPSFPNLAAAQSSRVPEIVERTRSPPLAFENSGSAPRPYQSTSRVWRPEAPQRVLSPPLAFQNPRPAPGSFNPSAGVRRPVGSPHRLDGGQRSFFDYDAQSHPRPSAVTSFVASHSSETTTTAKIARFQNTKRTRSPPLLSRDEAFSRNSRQSTFPSHSDSGFDNHNHLVPPSAVANNPSVDGFRPSITESQRPVLSPPARDSHAKLLGKRVLQDQSRSPPYVASYDSESSMGQVADVQGSKRIRSPPISSDNGFSWDDPQLALNDSKRPVLSSPLRDGHDKLLDKRAHQERFRVSPYLDLYDSESPMEQVADVQGPKQTRSPPVSSGIGVSREDPQFSLNDSKRLRTRSNNLFGIPDSQVPQRSLPSANNTVAAATRSTSFQVPKRMRSPPLLSADEGLQGSSNAAQYDTEREMQAKAKRLARFKVELSENVQINPDVESQKFTGGCITESARDYPTDNASSDYEGLDTPSSIIIGLCPDMCPESERGERERKGDLDQYERVDGDRNQTSKYLAVKKYTRTAEREANLIRPMPILQKTVGYMLDLLDQPYDERFLRLYNFLWDRMRAIRMDLRMQHIFNQEAITMLEQMIRLHIIAMHELCEYTKGEGFSEGFDAHLNIEQMNKTSVELFQMYDDHRKKGINVPTEKEFRGYYALLKLDKHPGYKVEPAELSLDLAKMTPEIRQMPEVLFARDVARACRMGNYIAFFRLARKASYLQACLMHAHFAKLRTQALASLHSGLLNNQGIPVDHVRKWLGMEEEDVESLLEYHGFLIKEFEEPYMVKEGPFLNSDKDYPTRCSILVHMKRSEMIVKDISASSCMISLPAEAPLTNHLGKTYKHDKKATSPVKMKTSVDAVDEEIPDPAAISSPKNSTSMQPMVETSMVEQQSQVDDHLSGTSVSPWGFSVAHSSPKSQVSGASVSPWGFSVAQSSPKSQPAKVVIEEKQNDDALLRMSPEKKIAFGMQGSPVQIVSRTSLLDRSPSYKRYDCSVENSLPQSIATNNLEDEELPDTHQGNENNELMETENDEVMANHLEEEVALAKQKLILRLWRRRTSKQKVLREQRQLAANAALSSLSLGLPIRQNKDQPRTLGEFDIDHFMKERYEKHVRSWSRMNVSDVIAGILGRRNPDAKCLCWKIVLCSQDSVEGDKHMKRSEVSHLAAEPWLFSKLMPPQKDDDDDLVVSSPGLSIWKKWVPSQSGTDMTCCFSSVKEMKFDHLDDTLSGASAVLFLVSESIPWKLQKNQLHNLLMSIPSGSCLPLLILSGSYNKEVLDLSSVIVNELGLHGIDKSRVSSFSVKILAGDEQMGYSDEFFSDEQLREGLQWLASESPLQPVVYRVKTREHVMTHLSPTLEVLDTLNKSEVGPNHCISAFNEALDQSLGEIVTAAKTNPTNWPCPEIALVEDSSNSHFLKNLYLPNVGWSSAARVEPLQRALAGIKLPAFPDDIHRLNRGSNMGKDIENQRSLLENCLIRYLTVSSEMMGVPLAMNEASIMLQRNTRLELRNSSYYIVPNWVMIFRRIFNWRLMSLTNADVSSAYVLEHHLASTSGDPDKLGREVGISLSSPYSLSHPSLDEIIEINCSSPLSAQRTVSQPQQVHQYLCSSPLSTQRAVSRPQQVHQYPPGTTSKHEVQEPAKTNDSLEDERLRNSSRNGESAVPDDISCITNKLRNSGSKIVVSERVEKETGILSQLLERCNLLQNKIGKKLSVYF